jgi:hypothetical protein
MFLVISTIDSVVQVLALLLFYAILHLPYDVSFILLDEADFFPPGQQADARDVSERYIAKSNPYIVMVSLLVYFPPYSYYSMVKSCLLSVTK